MGKIFNGWFFSWLALAAILTVAMLIGGQPYARPISAIIMASFTLMPVRHWLYRFAVWAIEYVSSISTTFKDRILKYATYNKLLDPAHRVENKAFYRVLSSTIAIISVIAALLWLIFQGTSFNVVYAFLHTIECLVRGKIGAVALLFYILITLAFCYLVYWFVGQVLNGVIYTASGCINWANHGWKIGLMAGGFYAKIIISGLLLCYTAGMVFSAVIFWTVTIGFPIAVFEIWNLIQRHRTPPTP